MKIAAFDPGIGVTGYAIVEGDRAIDYGVIETPPRTPVGDRCLTVYTDVIALLTEHKPVQVAYEKPHFGVKMSKDGKPQTNTNSALVQNAVGAMLAAFSLCGYSYPIEMAASTLKKNAVGHGHAKKTVIKPAVLKYYGLIHKPGTKDDVYDALACAIAAQNLIAANAA